MLNAVVMVEDPIAAAAIEQLSAESQQVQVLKSLTRLSGGHELCRLVNTYQPDLVFIELTDDATALSLAEAMHEANPFLAIVGVGSRSLQRWFEPMTQAGIAVFLATPVTQQDFDRAVCDAIRRNNQDQLDNLTCFLPAKAGSGATTVALNVAGFASKFLKAPTLLIEADLHSGIVCDLLQIEPAVPMRNVLAEASELDKGRWRDVVVPYNGIDVLPTDRTRKEPVPTWIDYFHLLRFVASRYELIVVDLPEIINDATAEIVRRARSVNVVTTPERSPLKLAAQRLGELASHGVNREQISLVVNRWHKADMQPREIESLLKHPVSAVLRNDYASIRKAQGEGGYVARNTQLGQSYLDFASKLTGRAAPAPERSGLLQSLTRR